MIAKINQLLEEVGALKAANAEELEALRIKYLSKKGAINDLMADFRNVAAEQKKEVGMKLNELKTKAQEKNQRTERTVRQPGQRTGRSRPDPFGLSRGAGHTPSTFHCAQRNH